MMTFVPGEGLLEIGPYPELQSMVYGQWFTHIFAVWEERYRGRLALAHGLAPDGDRWRRTDLLIPLFGDIRTIRNDFVHNQGVATSPHETRSWRGDPTTSPSRSRFRRCSH
ncbi:hypothetical protein BJF84_15960 [Rhodococcus sp. CUA-806]|nr:hypothetical protein BJF84_15960 [Rhodococcus sp. CUA-806]